MGNLIRRGIMESIKIEDLRKVRYQEESTFEMIDGIAEFVDGRWSAATKSPYEVRWWPAGDALPECCYKEVRMALAPIAEAFGVELTDEIVASHNPRSFLDEQDALIEERCMKAEGESPQPDITIRWVRTYKTKGGQLVHLLGDERRISPHEHGFAHSSKSPSISLLE